MGGRLSGPLIGRSRKGSAALQTKSLGTLLGARGVLVDQATSFIACAVVDPDVRLTEFTHDTARRDYIAGYVAVGDSFVAGGDCGRCRDREGHREGDHGQGLDNNFRERGIHLTFSAVMM